MKQRSVKKLAADMPSETSDMKVTGEELMRAKYLFANRELCSMRLQVTSEAQALLASNAELSEFERSLSEKYGVASPLQLGDDGTISSASPPP